MIVFLNEALAVLNKPPGLSMQTPRSSPGAAVARLLAALSETEGRELGSGELHLVHRLDVGTSGLVVLARHRAMHSALTTAFGERRVERAYLAVVWGRPRPRAGAWEWALGPDKKDRRRMRVEEAGKPAVTRYEVRAVAPHVSLVELRPETGRTHQIRVHLAHAGHPIVGDDLYGGPRHHAVKDPRLRSALDPGHTLLHAWRLTLPAPPLAVPLLLEASLPPSFATAMAACGWGTTDMS